MARTGYGKHATQVDTNTYPDDPNVPIGSDEWNAEPSDSGMLGFSAETIASATTITPSNTVLIISGSTDVATIAQGNTNEYDLLYIFTSGTVTLVHNTGNLQLISGANKDLSTTIPTILIRKGTDWVEYGGGGNVTGTVMSGHIIPDTNNTYDIGSAEFKIRDMYVSDNSLWVGDDHKVEISGGKMKFKKRKNNRVPTVITNAGGSASGAKSNRSRGNLTDMTLNDWVRYARSLGGSLANAKPNDIFKSDDTDDWESDEASITSAQASAITANTAKTGITSGQASAITTNTAKVGLSNTAVTDAHLAGNISLSKLANGTAGKIIGFNADTGVIEEQDAPSGGGTTFGTGSDGVLTLTSGTDSSAYSTIGSHSDSGGVRTFTLTAGTKQYTTVDIGANCILTCPSSQRTTLLLANTSVNIANTGVLSVDGRGGDSGAKGSRGSYGNSNNGVGGTGGNGDNNPAIRGYNFDGASSQSGGAGGSGSAGNYQSGGAGSSGGSGAGAVAKATPDWSASDFTFLPTLYSNLTTYGNSGAGGAGGGGGGGGGSGAQRGFSRSGGRGGYGGYGGLGGRGGGTLFLMSPEITVATGGLITSNAFAGESGYDGENGSGASNAGDGGGGGQGGAGGGGNGGMILFVSNTLTNCVDGTTVQANGSSGGSSGGANGTNGSSSGGAGGTGGGTSAPSGVAGGIVRLII